jgi:hypothetical protein
MIIYAAETYRSLLDVALPILRKDTHQQLLQGWSVSLDELQSSLHLLDGCEEDPGANEENADLHLEIVKLNLECDILQVPDELAVAYSLRSPVRRSLRRKANKGRSTKQGHMSFSRVSMSKGRT